MATSRIAALGLATLLSMTGLVLVLIVVLLAPPTRDLVTLAIFLLISGGVSVLIGLAGSRLGGPWWLGSLRARLVLVSAVTAALALANVGFTAALMFLSTHDLALLTALLGFSLGMSVFVAVALSSSTRRALREVVDGVRLLNAGSLETRVPVRSGDEMSELASALNSMAERLDASFRRERDLEQARKDLIGAVSHDLRTPLASIRAMIESINDGIVTDSETIQRYLQTTQKRENLGQLINDVLDLSQLDARTFSVAISPNHPKRGRKILGQLINDVFDLSQLDAGLLELQMRLSPLQDVVSNTVQSMAAQAAAGHLSLEGNIPEDISPVTMDPRLIQRVLCNLVQNAIRHTPPDGTIHVRAHDKGSEVEVQVVDTGEGIPEQDLDRLFERSYRSDPSRSRTSGGAGLGLSIARGIVEAHGGRIGAKSILGRGSTFSIVLPKQGAGVTPSAGSS